MKKESSIYRFGLFFYIVALLPISASLLCILLYILSHDIQRFPLISEATTILPESRIYSVAINITSWLTIPLFIIIDKILMIRFKNNKCDKSFSIKITRFIRNVIAFLSFASLIALSTVNLAGSQKYHSLFAIITYVLLSIYFYIIDSHMEKAKLDVQTVDFVWDFIGPINYISGFLILLNSDQLENAIYTMASLMQIIGYVLLFTKFISIYKRLPSFGITLKSE